jgi:transcriptional activator SPT8
MVISTYTHSFFCGLPEANFGELVATSQISEDESDNENDDADNEADIDNEPENDNENENENENEEEDVEMDADADGDQENDQSSSPSTHRQSATPPPPPPRIRKRSPPPLQPKADTCSSFDIVPVLAAPHATSVNAITATRDMRWVFTGGSDGYIRKFDHFAGMNGKVPLTVAQKHPFVDSVTKVGFYNGITHSRLEYFFLTGKMRNHQVCALFSF